MGRKMEIIELDSMATVAAHGNLWNTPANQLRRKIGTYTQVYVGSHSGTVRDSEGKYWDWWTNQDGTITVIEAR